MRDGCWPGWLPPPREHSRRLPRPAGKSCESLVRVEHSSTPNRCRGRLRDPNRLQPWPPHRPRRADCSRWYGPVGLVLWRAARWCSLLRNAGRTAPLPRPTCDLGVERLSILDGRFDRRRVGIDINLTGQFHDGIHDLIGDPAEHLTIVAGACVGAKVHWLTDPDAWAPNGGNAQNPGAPQLGVDHGHRDHRHTGLQDEPRNTGLSLIEAPIRGSGAFGIDAQ